MCWFTNLGSFDDAKGAQGPIQDLYLRVHLVKNGVDIKRLSFRRTVILCWKRPSATGR